MKIPISFRVLFLLFISLLVSCLACDDLSTSNVRKKKSAVGIGGSDGGFTMTLWVETDSEPDAAYYDQLAQVLTDNPNFSFGKVLVRVNGDGAAVGEPWYASMNPAGNGNNPIILEILRKLEGTDIEVYEIPYLSKTVKTGDDERWDIYTGMSDDAPSLASWWMSLGVAPDYYHGSLKQAVRWAHDMNAAATALGITKQFTGIIFEPEGSPYPNTEATLNAIKTYQTTFGTTLKVGMTGDAGQGFAYTGYAQDGVLDEGYLQLYNLTSTVSGSDTIYIDAKNSSSLPGKTTIPAYPNSIYTDAWLSNPVSAYQMIWTTPNLLNPGQEMGFEFNTVLLNGLLTADFYNNGKGYPYGCADGGSNCPKIYFMFSTECGPDLPGGITCDCVIAGCPQSQISAFGSWSSEEGAEQFKNFLNLANEQWQIPTNHFAIFQYQLIPKKWLGL